MRAQMRAARGSAAVAGWSAAVAVGLLLAVVSARALAAAAHTCTARSKTGNGQQSKRASRHRLDRPLCIVQAARGRAGGARRAALEAFSYEYGCGCPQPACVPCAFAPEPYLPRATVPQPVVQSPYVQNPYVQNPYVQNPYVPSPYVPSPYAPNPSYPALSVADPTVPEPYVPKVRHTSRGRAHLAHPPPASWCPPLPPGCALLGVRAQAGGRKSLRGQREERKAKRRGPLFAARRPSLTQQLRVACAAGARCGPDSRGPHGGRPCCGRPARARAAPTRNRARSEPARGRAAGFRRTRYRAQSGRHRY